MSEVLGFEKACVAEKYVKVVQHMYKDSMAVMSCAVRVTDGCLGSSTWNQALGPCLHSVLMDR